MHYCAFLFAICAAALSGAAANAAEPAPYAPLTPAQIHLLYYAHVQFPRQLQAASDQAALAEQRHVLFVERANSYAPFRSFGPYGATYFADQQAQFLATVSAREVASARQQKIDVWRERQAVATAILLESGAFDGQ